MHVLFIHPNFPNQFYGIAAHLHRLPGWKVTLLTSVDTSHLQLPFDHGAYPLKPGPLPKVFYNPDNLPALMDHLPAVYQCLQSAPQFRPDLVVGHVSYGTWLYLRNLYDCPFVGYYELLPAPFWSAGMVLREDFPPSDDARLFNATYHALTYLHLHAMDAGYTPTRYQLNTAPAELRHKLRVIFDGVDTSVLRRRDLPRPFQFRGLTIDADTRVVTFVSRGLEATRGSDIFMRAAKIIQSKVPNVIFLIAGDERTNYGHEQFHIGNQTFKQYVLSQDSYDLSRYHFVGSIPVDDLVDLYSLSDVHIYLTVPFVLSWSLIMAMACECTIVGSATSPVQEVIDDDVHGLLADFYDAESIASRAVGVLREPEKFKHLGKAAKERVLQQYSETVCHEQLIEFFRSLRKG